MSFLGRALARTSRTVSRTFRQSTRSFSLLSGSSWGGVSAVKAPEIKAVRHMSDGPFTETTRDFLDPGEFLGALRSHGMDFYAGVPDSLLKDFCGYVSDNVPEQNHVMTANEGSAVAIAAGYHLATRKFPIVYMQNSGFGNAVNPLLSLADPRVYSIPMLLLIGWRGEPGKKDEPQHLVQGKVMSSMLTDMNIQFEVLPDYIDGARETVNAAAHHMRTRQAPYALLVKRQTFTPYKMKNTGDSFDATKATDTCVLPPADGFPMTREQALEVTISEMDPFDVSVATTGFCSRELYELREKRGESHAAEFLTVGSMGHAGAIAAGIAVGKPSRQVFCLDGDGGCIMHMGAMATLGQSGLRNVKHVLFNNGAHDSVGGQTTGAFNIDFTKIASSCGYSTLPPACDADTLSASMRQLREVDGPAFLEVRIRKGARQDLGRPATTPVENKKALMDFLDG